MNPFTFAVFAAAAAFATSKSHAEDLPYNGTRPQVEYKQTGNTYQWKPVTGPMPSGGGVFFRGDNAISNAQPKIVTQAKLPFDTRSNIPPSQLAKVTSPFTQRAFGKAIALGARSIWPIGVIIGTGAIYDYLRGLDYSDIQNTPNGITAKTPKLSDFDGRDYRFDGDITMFPWQNSKSSACSALISFFKSVDPPVPANNYPGTTGGSLQDGKCVRMPYGIPYDLISRTSSNTSAEMVTHSEQDIIDKIAVASGWPSAAARALQSALNNGATIETGTPTVDGPATVPGTTTTSTTSTQLSPGTTTSVAPGTPGAQAGTKTTTTSNTTNVTYNNSTATTNNKTTTTTTITNNVTNQSTTTTDKTEEDDKPKEKEEEPEDPPTDTELGEIPELYERKYPDGLSGIWETKSQEIKQSPLFTLADDLMPTGVGGGSCPSWSLDLSFGGAFGDYGSQDVSPPCWIWDVAKLIIIASALILARALVFGG